MGECVLNIINIDGGVVFVHHPTMSMTAALMSCIESSISEHQNTSSIEPSYVYDVLCSINIDACIWQGFVDDDMCALSLDVPSAPEVHLCILINDRREACLTQITCRDFYASNVVIPE
jgi:hypothetical protein